MKKVFIRSGIRFDYLLADKSDAFFKKLVSDHVSGQLKVAPEHCASAVLRCMGKPDFNVYQTFRKKYFELSEACGKEQYLVPYLMSSHPGSTLNEAIELALCLKRDHYAPEQVQDYYPTPGTASTVMFYTGINPLDMKPVHVVTDYHEKQLQRALLQYNKPENADLVREALKKAGREDLIGLSPDCLVRPASSARGQSRTQSADRKPSNGSQAHRSEKSHSKNGSTPKNPTKPDFSKPSKNGGAKRSDAKPFSKKNSSSEKKHSSQRPIKGKR